MKAQDFVRATVAYHDELCPAAWDGDTMKSDVRERLIGIAQLFIGYLEVEGFVVDDIVLTGSLANYNWTQFSDFDLHIVTDYKNLNAGDIAEAFYRAKKTIWNDRHDITIYGHEVELYVEDINEPPVSGGVFSVLHDQWIKTPNHKNPNVNDTAVVRKVQELKDQIERCIATADDPEDLKRLTDKLSKLRRSGLDDGGEFSVENLAFKTLRNMGIIAALHKAYTNKQDNLMTLREFNWTDHPDTPVDDLLIIAEEHFTRNGKLLESNDPDRSKYFLDLESMSSPLVANKKYIALILGMVGNRVVQLNYPEVVTFLGKSGNAYKVILSNGRESTFPNTRMSDKMTSATFFFNSNVAYDKFRTILTMKFDTDLASPDEVTGNKGNDMRLNEFAPGGGFEPPKRPPVPGNRRDDDDERPEIMPLADVAKAIMMHIGDAFTCERMRDHRGKFNPAQPGYKFVPKDKTKFGMAKIWCQGDRRGEFPVYHTSLYNYFMGSDGKVLATGQMVEKMKQKTNRNAMHTAELIYNHTAGALKQSVAEADDHTDLLALADRHEKTGKWEWSQGNYEGAKQHYAKANELRDRAKKAQGVAEAPRKPRKPAAPQFTKYTNYELWERERYARGANYSETEIDGRLVGVAVVGTTYNEWGYVRDTGKVVGMWYNKASIGSFVQDGTSFDDSLSYAEQDTTWPYMDESQGVAEGSDDKVAKHNAAVSKMTKRSFAKLDYNHPDLLKKAPKGYSFDASHKLSKQDVTEGMFDIFKKKTPEPEMTYPGEYPRSRADIGQWMTDTVEYYKVKHPESLFKLFCPSYKDYLPVRVRVATSEQVMAQHMGTYKQLRDANPEAKKLARQRYTEYEKYPSGPSDDYTNRVG
jgi:hypothetical protein